MCGLTGFWAPGGDPASAPALLQQMTDALQHRGPDAGGVYVDDQGGPALGHRRLSIIDLSALGAQPMHGASGRYVMVYNGEVYNYAELAADLAAGGRRFRGGSDTEVLIAAIETWGLEAALSRFVGMFAFALYDRDTHELVLARDRLGIKPLYYCLHDDVLLFGSELKALMAHPALPRDLDMRALFHYLRLGYIPAPDTIFERVRKLPQGHLLRVRRRDRGLQADAPQSFWHLADMIDTARATPGPETPEAALTGFRSLLDTAVADRLVADVPLGAFLSGGIDSSLVVAAMQRIAPGSVKTFSIGFNDPAYNEARHAAEIAAHLGTEHHELIFEDRALQDLVPELPHFWDEPFGDSSQLPTLLLARFARRHVTVALSGDGGDELAAGYVRHRNAGWMTRRMALPAALRAPAGALLRGVPTGAWDRLFQLVPARRRPRLPGDKLHKLGRALAARSPESLYREVVSLDTLGPLTRRDLWPADDDHAFPWRMPTSPLTPAEDFMVRDTFRYLADDMLTKVDRATMAAGLEARVPLLDHRLMAFVWSLPEHLKLAGGTGKLLLREALALDVPRALWDRPKMGFAAPVGAWLRGPLKPWAADLLADVPAHAPYLDADRCARLWRMHLAGRGNTTSPLWHLLMFLAWRRTWAP